ncbi:MAG: hypothetical protein HYX28_01225 [Candidatus Koribacter versatilis]|uniref:Uncharacterized protein n=1 Tax=Candidatus Korobacter versatilis TaxID=658062 RepID=A0A932ENJ1_9BACT|nr:hypothetical protein [Candidatus Koribacter versatilis]
MWTTGVVAMPLWEELCLGGLRISSPLAFLIAPWSTYILAAYEGSLFGLIGVSIILPFLRVTPTERPVAQTGEV